MELMRRQATIQAALARAPGGPVTTLPNKPLVRVRAVYGRALAYTDTHVLHEWVKGGEHFARWDLKWQVVRVTAEDWDGESLDLP